MFPDFTRFFENGQWEGKQEKAPALNADTGQSAIAEDMVEDTDLGGCGEVLEI